MNTWTLDQLNGAVGTHLGYSDWHTITQEQIDQFAAATGDHQWIHTDPQKAADGPFGTTIAHGYLVLSHIPLFLSEAFEISGLTMAVNYGSNKVRYSAPVPVGSRLRGGVELIDVAQRPNGTMAVMRVTVELHGTDKPACVAEVVSLLVPGQVAAEAATQGADDRRVWHSLGLERPGEGQFSLHSVERARM